jgi:hypothetical protein
MTRRLLAAVAAAALIATATACSPTSEAQPTAMSATAASTTPSPTPAASPPAAAEPTPPAPAAAEAPDQVIGTVVRFTSDRTSVDVTIGEDSPAVRDLLSMLPLRIPFEDLAGREKIAYLPRELNFAGSPGSDPEDGDLIYYTSWGNLGFYYNAAGIDYSDATLHLGTYDATEEQLSLLEGGVVAIEIIN